MKFAPRIIPQLRRSAPIVAILAASISCSLPEAQAANATWQAAPTNSNWVALLGEDNWTTVEPIIPGATSGLTNADTATFLTSGTTTITINSPTLNVRSITFGNVASPSAFTIGSTAGNLLLLSSGGAISITSGRTTAGATETVNAPLELEPASAATAGTYTFSNASSLSGDILVIGGAITGGTTTADIALTLTGASTTANTISGAISNGLAAGVSLSKTSSGTWGLTGINIYTGATSISGGTIASGALSGTLTLRGANGSLTATSAINLSGGRLTLDNTTTSGGANGNRVNDSAAINVTAGPNVVNFSHSGVAATNYSETLGTLNLSGGDLQIAASTAAASQTSTLTFSGFNRTGTSTLSTSGTNLGTTRNGIILTGLSGPGIATFLGGWATYNSQGQFAAYDTTLGITGAAITNLAGVTAGSSISTANYRAGTATVLATASGVYSGNTLAFASGASGNLDLNSSTIKLSGGGITTAGDIFASTISNGTITAADTASPTTLYIHSRASGGQTFTISASIADPTGGGSLSLVKAGNSGLTLSGANTFTGTTSINSGSITLSNALALQNSILDYSNQGGTLALTNAATNYRLGGLGGAQNLQVQGALVTGVTLGNSNGGTGTNATYSGTLTLSNAIGLTKAGANTQTFTGTLTTNGNSVTLAGGALALGSSAALGTTGNVIFTGGTLQHSATNTTDYSARIATGTSTGPVSIDTNGQTVTYATALTASQSGGLSKKGAGTLTLPATNNFTGPTNVTGGFLEITGSINATTAVNVTGGTLLLNGGSEKVAAVATTLDGGTLQYSSGNAGGFTETLGTLTLSNTASLDFGSTTGSGNTFFFAGLDTATAAAMNGGNTITLNIYNWTNDGAIQDRLVFDTSTGLDAGLAQINFFSGPDNTSPLGTGRQIAFGANDFEIVPIPEPSGTALLGAAGLLGFIGFRESRRLRRKSVRCA